MPPLPPVGFAVDLAPRGDLRAALVGRKIFYWISAGGPKTGGSVAPLRASGCVVRHGVLARGGVHAADVGAARHGP